MVEWSWSRRNIVCVELFERWERGRFRLVPRQGILFTENCENRIECSLARGGREGGKSWSCGIHCTACMYMYILTHAVVSCIGGLSRVYLKHHWVAKCVESEPFFPLIFSLSPPVTGILAASVLFVYFFPRRVTTVHLSPPYAYTIHSLIPRSPRSPGGIGIYLITAWTPELSVFKTCDCWYISTMQYLVRSITDRRFWATWQAGHGITDWRSISQPAQVKGSFSRGFFFLVACFRLHFFLSFLSFFPGHPGNWFVAANCNGSEVK